MKVKSDLGENLWGTSTTLSQLCLIVNLKSFLLKTMIVFFSGTLQVHLPRNRRLRRPVQEQGRGVRLLRAGQFHQQQNSERLAEKIIEKRSN